jgi:hypothetical protein
MDIPERFSLIADPCGQRTNTASLLIDILSNGKLFRESPDGYKKAIIIGIERGILNYSIDFMQNKNKIASWTLNVFVDEYKKKRYSLCCMLEKIGTPSYVYLENIIVMRTIDWCDLATARPFELHPVRFAPIMKILEIRSNMEIEMKFMNGLYECKNCKSTKYKEYSVQVRSSDEPAHLFRICGGCGKRTIG